MVALDYVQKTSLVDGLKNIQMGGNGKRVGIFFSYNENWIGGSYYIINLIEALKLLPADKQPHLSIFYYQHSDMLQIISLGYPKIDFEPIDSNRHFLKRVSKFLARRLFKKKIFASHLYKTVPKGYYDAVFPMPIDFDQHIAKRLIYWVPDFQDIHLPHFFSSQSL